MWKSKNQSLLIEEIPSYLYAERKPLFSFRSASEINRFYHHYSFQIIKKERRLTCQATTSTQFALPDSPHLFIVPNTDIPQTILAVKEIEIRLSLILQQEISRSWIFFIEFIFLSSKVEEVLSTTDQSWKLWKNPRMKLICIISLSKTVVEGEDDWVERQMHSLFSVFISVWNRRKENDFWKLDLKWTHWENFLMFTRHEHIELIFSERNERYHLLSYFHVIN